MAEAAPPPVREPSSPGAAIAFCRGFFFYGLLASIAGLAAFFLAGGVYLLALGGSAYYAASGAWLGATAYFLARRRRIAAVLLFAYFIATWIWAIVESGGLKGWVLLPRVDVISGVMLVCSLPVVLAQLGKPAAASDNASSLRHPFARLVDRLFEPRLYLFGAVASIIALMAVGVVLSSGQDQREADPSAGAPAQPPTAGDGEWRHFGRTLAGTRFSPASQVTPATAPLLARVWDYKEPDPPAHMTATATAMTEGAPGRKDEATPLMVGDKVFVCMPDNVVVALDAETGALAWRHDPHVSAAGVYWQTCRGVSYYEHPASAACPRRILAATTDARMIALNADTGERCADFGSGGEISLKDGLGPVEPGMYYTTSPPTVVGGVAVVGAWVTDNVSVDEPSGVIRAFDAVTGQLAWAWDMGRPETETGAPSPGQAYTRGTPNAWSIFSADENLGLVYVPTGNATPDFVGGHRKPAWEPYSSALVALDATTGRVRWSFQTVHHDLWDYDVASQPSLTTIDVNGQTIPVVVQATKRGEIFVLDRRDGKPVSAIAEKPVPQTDVPGERTSPTQPFATGLPSLAGPPLRERDMWGISPIDQLLCRIAFKQLRYDGPMTPPSIRGSIDYPGPGGGVDWGGVTIDEDRGLLVTQSMRLAFVIRLIPRKSLDEKAPASALPQKGTPFFATALPFQSRLRVPCQQPPFSLLTAIDLKTGRVVWQKPFGTAEGSGPLGIKSHLPITIGSAPHIGGAITTRGGLTIIGAATDRRLRVIDTQTGREVWSELLPEGNQATPMTYIAPRSRRQMIVIVSGGHTDLERNVASHVVAFALPQ